MIWPFECTPSSMTGASCLHPHGSIKHGIRRALQHDSCQGSAKSAGILALQACALCRGPFPSLPRGSALPPIEPYPTKQPTSVPRAPKLHRRTVLS